MSPYNLKFLGGCRVGREVRAALTSCYAKLRVRWLIAVIGIVIMAAGFAIPSIYNTAKPTRQAGLLITGGALMLITRSHIRTRKQPGFRRWLWTAWCLAGVGFLLVVISSIIDIAGDRLLAHALGFTAISVLILGPVVVSFLGLLITQAGTWPFIAACGLLVIFLLTLPPLVVLMTGQTPHYLLGPQETGAPGAWELIVLLILVIAVELGPIYISTWLSWETATKVTRRLLPETMATIATTATIAYVIILHASKGPLDSSPLMKVVVAGLIAAVFLRPMYRYLAITCWRSGTNKKFIIEHLRSNQITMLNELYSRWRESELRPEGPQETEDQPINIAAATEPTRGTLGNVR